MLPPPITRHSSTPKAQTDSISCATRATISGSRPYSRVPINASPDTLRRTRRYLRSAGMRLTQIRPDRPVSGSGLRVHQTGHVVASFDSLPGRAGKPRHAPIMVPPYFRFRLDPWIALALSERRVSSALELSRHLGREIGTITIDPLAERVAHIARHPNRRARSLRRLVDHD